MNEIYFPDPPTYIITGATGWLGKRVVLSLLEKSKKPNAHKVSVGEIRALITSKDDKNWLRNHGVDTFEGDLRDPDSLSALMEGCKNGIFLSLAGVIHPSFLTRDFKEINYQGTLNAVIAAKRAGIKRAVVMSSNSPFGINPGPDHLFDENSPYNPYMGYGRSKMLMEKALVELIEKGDGPEISIIRAPWFYGPGQPSRQTMFFSLIRQGKFPILGDGSQKRSMAFVDTLATGILLAATSSKSAGQVYWIADERPYSFLEIVKTVREVLHEDFAMEVAEKIVHFPSIISDIARVADGALQRIGLYQQKIHVLSELNTTIACDIKKAKSDLGFKPVVELREGMRRSIAWCLDNGHSI